MVSRRTCAGRRPWGIMDSYQAPLIGDSTQEERERYVRDRYPCISDCDACGICAVFRGQDALTVYREYIEGKREFMEISREYAR